MGALNLLKGGLVFRINDNGEQEVCGRDSDAEYGHGLDGVARSRADRLVGILNGVDYGAWNPEKDKLIAANYSAKDLSREAGVQETVGSVWAVARSPGTAGDRKSCRVSRIKKASI